MIGYILNSVDMSYTTHNIIFGIFIVLTILSSFIMLPIAIGLIIEKRDRIFGLMMMLLLVEFSSLAYYSRTYMLESDDRCVHTIMKITNTTNLNTDRQFRFLTLEEVNKIKYIDVENRRFAYIAMDSTLFIITSP